MRSAEGIFNEIKSEYESKHGAKVAFIRKRAAEHRTGKNYDEMGQREAMILAHQDWNNLPSTVFIRTGMKKDFIQTLVIMRQLEYPLEKLSTSAIKAKAIWDELVECVNDFMDGK